MRKVAGVLLVSALMLPVGLVASNAGAAAATPTCKALAGTATFSPADSEGRERHEGQADGLDQGRQAQWLHRRRRHRRHGQLRR